MPALRLGLCLSGVALVLLGGGCMQSQDPVADKSAKQSEAQGEPLKSSVVLEPADWSALPMRVQRRWQGEYPTLDPDAVWRASDQGGSFWRLQFVSQAWKLPMSYDLGDDGQPLRSPSIDVPRRPAASPSERPG